VNLFSIQSAMSTFIGLLSLGRHLGLSQVHLIWNLMLDPEISIVYKLIPLFFASFVFSPLNIFGWIPFIGQSLNIGLLVYGFSLFLRMCPPNLVEKHRLELLPPKVREREIVANRGVVGQQNWNAGVVQPTTVQQPGYSAAGVQPKFDSTLQQPVYSSTNVPSTKYYETPVQQQTSIYSTGVPLQAQPLYSSGISGPSRFDSPSLQQQSFGGAPRRFVDSPAIPPQQTIYSQQPILTGGQQTGYSTPGMASFQSPVPDRSFSTSSQTQRTFTQQQSFEGGQYYPERKSDLPIPRDTYANQPIPGTSYSGGASGAGFYEVPRA